MRIKTNKAFTLIELFISITILTVVLLALISGYIGCLRINEMSENTTVAITDARQVIEQMRSLSVSDLTSIISENWTTWALNNGLNSLDSEQIIVVYTDRDASGSATDDDPLEVTVNVNWQDGTRPRSISLATLITVR
ncbi:MAG: type II secretion system protein [Candidatus Omnitrophota bacterium]